MRANPHYLSGLNKLWVKFFLNAVFATMHVRDHARPEFHKALGVDINEYDFKVFRLTSEISKQCFPLTLDLDHPAFAATLERMRQINVAMEPLRGKAGIGAKLQRGMLSARAGANFLRLMLIPSKKNEIPATSRLQPVW